MKWFTAILSLPLLSAMAFGAEPEPIKKGLVVHEWGVFRVNNDADFANADLRAEWDELPEFIYGHIKGRVVPQHWGAIEIRRRPIVFFHTDTPMTAQVKIDFPGGQAGVWYPATEFPSIERFQKQPKIGNSLRWNLSLKQSFQGIPAMPSPRPVAEKHWIARLRQVKCDEIFARFGPNAMDVEREKFLYYDGLFPQGKWVKIAVEKDRLMLTSQVKHALYDVTVVDRRGDKVRIGRLAKLEAGATSKIDVLQDVSESSITSEAAAVLHKQLVEAGLNSDEALSLVDLWKKELFETPGLNLFYRLPQEEYEARLPLTVTPKPVSTVRVGLVYHAHLEPDFAAQILELARQLDAPRFATRDAAMKKLLQIGPAALVELQRLKGKKELSTEAKERIDAILKKWDAKQAFDIDVER